MPTESTTGPSPSLTSGYRGDGLRAWKQPNGGSKTYFLYDGEVLACELDSSGNVSAVPTFGPAGLVSRRAGGTTTYMHFDPQGGLSQTTDGSGNVVASYGWDAYGTALNGSAGVYGYGAQWGYYTDTETGLQLLTYRMYDPAVGRFVNRDPIGYDGGVNLYGYAGNDPVGAADPSGLTAYWIIVPHQDGSPLGFHHSYISFGDDRCMGSPAIGFWPGIPSEKGSVKDWGGSQGAFHGVPGSEWPVEEANGDLGRWGWAKSDDMAFERALCDCIKEAVGRGAPTFRSYISIAPPGGFYVCASWAADMWACAYSRVHISEIGGTPTIPGSVPGEVPRL